MDDAEYLAKLKKETNLKVVVQHMLDNWDFFCGDSYYRDFQDAFKEKLKELSEVKVPAAPEWAYSDIGCDVHVALTRNDKFVCCLLDSTDFEPVLKYLNGEVT